MPSAYIREYRFQMWDWVGGRYSVWSSIGVSLAIAIGARQLPGVPARRSRDRRALPQRPPGRRICRSLMGLIGVWNINFMHLPTLAVLPYDDSLRRFPAYLQQLEMESNGKSVMLDGEAGAVRDCRGDLGRAGQQRPALLLPATASGDAARGVRFPAAGPLVLRQPGAAEPRHRQLPGAGRGVHERAVRADGARRAAAAGAAAGTSGSSDSAQGRSRQPPEHDRAVPEARPCNARTSDRTLRAQRVSRRASCGESMPSISGGWSWARNSPRSLLPRWRTRTAVMQRRRRC